MQLMERVKEIQNLSLEKRIEQNRVLKDDFIKSIEKPVLEAAEKGLDELVIKYSIPSYLAIDALSEHGFMRWRKLREGEAVLYLRRPESANNYQSIERLIHCLWW